MGISALIFSFGYLIGLRYSVIIAMGSLLSWFVLIPLLNAVGDIAIGAGGTNLFASMEPGQIFKDYVRHIGIGAIAMAGIIGIIKSSKVIGGAFKMAFVGFKGDKSSDVAVERTQKDLKMSLVVTLIIVSLIAVFVFFILGVQITVGQAIVALLTVTIITFLFTTVAANAIAIVGQNPVSGMTLMTLILSSFILVQAGLKGEEGMIGALIIGGIVCTALSMAGGFVTDLKIGYWMGSSPYKQESWKFLGALVSAATVGIVIFILNQAYGFTVTPDTPDPLVAPQANAMAAVIKPLFMEGAGINWMLYFAGAMLAVIVAFLGLPPLAFALGMYLPLELNTPLLIGGLIAHFVNKSSKDDKVVNARVQRGTLISSGFIAGAALFGVLGALMVFLDKELGWNIMFLGKDFNWWPEGSIVPEVLPIIAFGLIIVYFIWDTYRAKVDE
jgi:putative OPT family oligopeptide transporter